VESAAVAASPRPALLDDTRPTVPALPRPGDDRRPPQPERPGFDNDPDPGPVAPTRFPADPDAPRRTPPPTVRPGLPTRSRDPRRRTLGAALGVTAAATVAPGAGHLLLGKRRTGLPILAGYLLVLLGIALAVLLMGRNQLISTALSTSTLAAVALLSTAAALVWIAVIIRTWALARPPALGTGQRILGAGVVIVLCLTVAAPFGFAANLANSQRNLLNTLFKGGGTAAEVAIHQPRLNVLLLGSDAGPDRNGTRTDTMMVASIDTRTAKTILFGLPRNVQRAQFPPGSEMARRFPKGFHDPADPLSGNYLLNAVYAYAHENPVVAPRTPSDDPGINLLMSSVSYMLGLPLDYFLEVDMKGFASLIDALGGVTMDVGPVPLPIGGVLPDGRHVKPDGYIQPGVQKLDGEAALWFARSRRDSSDYDRMGRQRCLIQAVLGQKSPASLLTNFQSVARVATQNVRTDIPQALLPQLVTLLTDKGIDLNSVTFDPTLPDPEERDGRFNPADPDPEYMRAVVTSAIEGRPLTTPTPTPTTAPRATSPRTTTTAPAPAPTSTRSTSTAPVSLAASCAAPSAAPAPTPTTPSMTPAN
jgi:LCP family protein required for cell wall assembly